MALREGDGPEVVVMDKEADNELLNYKVKIQPDF